MEAYRKYGPVLLRKCERILRNRQDAEDVVQALFLDMIERGCPMDLPYLYRAATNRCLNILRDADRRRRLMDKEQPVLAWPSLAESGGRTLDMDVLQRLVDRLDRESREILVYRFLDDMGLEEIAGIMGTSRKTVSNKLARIRQELALLEGRAGGGSS